MNLIQNKRENSQCICGVRASLEPHKTYVCVLADLRRKKKREQASPYFRMAVVGARGFFFLKFWCWFGLDHTSHFAYMVYTCTSHSYGCIMHGLYVAVRADGHQEVKMSARDERQANSRRAFVGIVSSCMYTPTALMIAYCACTLSLRFWAREKPCVAWLTRGDRYPLGLERGGFRGYTKCEISRNWYSLIHSERAFDMRTNRVSGTAATRTPSLEV